MDLLVARHGESTFNAERRCIGWVDDELTERGMVQAEKLALQIPEDVDLIISSPLRRAFSTACIIGIHMGIPVDRVRRDSRLMERNCGTLARKTWEEIHKETGVNLHLIDRALAYDYREFGGESAEQVRARLDGFVAEFRTSWYECKIPLAITHGGVISLWKAEFPYSVVFGEENGGIGNSALYQFSI